MIVLVETVIEVWGERTYLRILHVVIKKIVRATWPVSKKIPRQI